MILRRIKAHVEKENWFAVFLDFCIVVVGVFIGIQVANWNDGRAEDRRERAYLERLDSEFGLVEARISRAIYVEEIRIRAIETLLNAWAVGPEAFSDPDAKGPGTLFIEIITNIVPADPPASFRELVSSGELSIIENADLRTALYEFDALSEVTQVAYEGTENDMQELRRLIYSAYLFDIRGIEDLLGAQPDTGNPVAGSIDGTFIPEAFFGNPDFRQALNGAALSIVNMRDLAERQQAMLERIDVLIEAELAQ